MNSIDINDQHHTPNAQRSFRVTLTTWIVALSLVAPSTIAWGQATTSSASGAASDNLSLQIQQAVSRISTAVVRIRVVGASESQKSGGLTSTVTTGLVVSSDGRILTSVFGLTSTPSALFIEDASGNRATAEVVATDHLRKLVLLKCDPSSLQLGTPEINTKPAVGAYALAAGRFYPSAGPSISVGIVSAANRIHGLALQTDAKVSPVNYGGPLIDIHGRVLGVLVPLSPQDSETEIDAGVEWYDSGIGFAIPIHDALESAARLKAGTDLKRGRLGIGLSSRNPLDPNVEVAAVHPGSPADIAGVQKGDRILAAGDTPTNRIGEFESTVKRMYAGQELSLQILRDNQQMTVSLNLADQLPPAHHGYLGIRPLTSLASDKDDKPSDGIPVAIVPGSPLASTNIAGSIIIKSINGNNTSDSGLLKKAVTTLKSGQSSIIEYRTAGEDQEVRNASVLCSDRPSQVPRFTDDQIRLLLGHPITSDPPKWDRAELEKEDSARSWIYAPTKPAENASYGAVVAVTSPDRSSESILAVWQATCQLHNLVLIVVKNQDGTLLTREDLDVLHASVTETQQRIPIKASRIVIVADDDSTGLVVRALSHPRLPYYHRAVFLTGWPRIRQSVSGLLQRKSVALLICGQTETRELQALQSSAVTALRAAGLSVITQQPSAATDAPALIANWLLLGTSH